MKSRAIAILIFASLVCAGLAGPAFAQSAQNEPEFQRYLNAHPPLRADLRANPNLVNDPEFMSRHQGFVQWLNKHPNMRNQAFWARENSARRNDGDWDDQHRWHDRNWWVSNNRGWVEQHHPNWAENQQHHEYTEHPNWSENGEHPNYGESEEHHGNGHAYGHDKDHGDHGNGHGHDHDD